MDALVIHLIEFPADDPDRARRADDVGPLVSERDIERWFADQQAREARQREVCSSKRWFATESEARAAALWDRTQFGENLSCYRCQECNGWHLTGGRGHRVSDR